jgi:uncharacterized glyoxalase superfamily protein PhnB
MAQAGFDDSDVKMYFIVEQQAQFASDIQQLLEAQELTYADRRCMVEDEWGNTWQIATHMGDRT